MGDEVIGGSSRRIQVKRERPTALTEAKRRRFLDVLAATANAQRAAAAAGADPSAFYRLRYRDGAFATAWREALDSAMVRLEGEMLAQALGERGGPSGDAERAGAAGRIDVPAAVALLRRGRDLGGGMAQRRRLPIEEVVRLLHARLEALARRAGRA